MITGARVELPRPQETRHQVPRVVHPAPGHAVDGHALEDELRRRSRTPSAWPACRASARARRAHELECLVDRGRHAATSRAPRRRRARRSQPCTAASAVRLGWTTSCAPIARASASRVWFTSLAITRDAPAATQMPTAKMPIGPQPVTAPSRPGSRCGERGVEGVPHRVVDAADLDRRCRRPDASTFVAGIAMNSAKQPSRSTPMIARVRADVRRCRCGRAWQCAADDVPLGGHAVADFHVASRASRPHRHSPANSWPTVKGGLQRPCAQSSHS